MDILSVNTIVIYPNIKPPKEIVLKVIYTEIKDIWIKIWMTKCKNIYYICSKNHPIFNIKFGVNILAHLFYILRSNSVGIKFPSTEYEIVSSFLNGTLTYVKKYSAKSYELSIQDPIVFTLYNEFTIPITVDSYTLSNCIYNLENIKKENMKIKEDFKNLFKNFEDELKNNINIVSTLLPKMVKPDKKDQIIQTETPNLWKNKPIIKKDAETQYIFKKNQRNVYTETIINKIDVETQTVIEKKNEVIIEKGKCKKKENNIVMSEKEFCEIMINHKNELEKTKEITEKNIRKNLVEFILKNPLETHEFYRLFMSINISSTIDIINIWCMDLVCRSFTDMLLMNGVDIINYRVNMLPFYSFWEELIMPNIGDIELTIFEKLRNEWKDIFKATSNCKIKLEEIKINIIFDYMTTSFISNFIDRFTFIPPFFSILFNNCRSIILLLSVIKNYDLSRKKMNRQIREGLISDFKFLFICPSPKDILFKNFAVINFDNEFTKQVYDIEFRQKIRSDEVFIA